MKGDMNPHVTAVIPTLNAEENLRDCLEHLTMQEYTGQLDIVIVDAGSTDATLEIARSFGAEVHVFPGLYSNGLDGARNVGLKFCRGDLYWQIDTDNIFRDKRALENLVLPFRQDKSLVISLPIVAIDESSNGLNQWLSHFEMNGINSMKAHASQEYSGYIVIDDMEYGIANGSLIKRDALLSVGGYDSDVRVLKRLREKSLSKGAIVTSAQMYHYQASSISGYIRKNARRVKLFASFNQNRLSQYFYSYRLRPSSQRRDAIPLVLAPFYAVWEAFKMRSLMPLWGIVFSICWFLIFLQAPLSSFVVFSRFLR